MVYNGDASDPQIVFEYDTVNSITIIRIRGRFRAMDFKDFNRLFQQFLDDADSTWLLLDVTDTKVLQSPVVGSIMGVSRLLNQVNKKIAVVNPSDHIRYIFELTRVTEVLAVFDTMKEALEYARSH